jgi:acetyltransferase-like isoleucine patch superfamily enzyme
MEKGFIHPTAIVENDQVGAHTRIWAYVHVMTGAKIGSNCNIGDHCFIESGACIGDNTIIKNGSIVWEGVTIEEGVFIGPHVFFTNDLYPRSRYLQQARNRYRVKKNWQVPTLVKRGASLGAGAIILAGVTIGEYSMIGAGAVITKDVPPYALMKGNPAQIYGWVCKCGKPLSSDNGTLTCKKCRLKFRKQNSTIRVINNKR